jgi:hypothetical protein
VAQRLLEDKDLRVLIFFVKVGLTWERIGDRLKSQLQREGDKMEDFLSQVKQLTGAEDAKVTETITEGIVMVLLAFPDGPDAYTFRHKLVDLSGDTVSLIGGQY